MTWRLWFIHVLFLEASILISQKYNHKMSIWNESDLCAKILVNPQILSAKPQFPEELWTIWVCSHLGTPALSQWPSSNGGDA